MVNFKSLPLLLLVGLINRAKAINVCYPDESYCSDIAGYGNFLVNGGLFKCAKNDKNVFECNQVKKEQIIIVEKLKISGTKHYDQVDFEIPTFEYLKKNKEIYKCDINGDCDLYSPTGRFIIGEKKDGVGKKNWKVNCESGECTLDNVDVVEKYVVAIDRGEKFGEIKKVGFAIDDDILSQGRLYNCNKDKDGKCKLAEGEYIINDYIYNCKEGQCSSVNEEEKFVAAVKQNSGNILKGVSATDTITKDDELKIYKCQNNDSCKIVTDNKNYVINNNIYSCSNVSCELDKSKKVVTVLKKSDSVWEVTKDIDIENGKIYLCNDGKCVSITDYDKSITGKYIIKNHIYDCQNGQCSTVTDESVVAVIEKVNQDELTISKVTPVDSMNEDIRLFVDSSMNEDVPLPGVKLYNCKSDGTCNLTAGIFRITSNSIYCNSDGVCSNLRSNLNLNFEIENTYTSNKFVYNDYNNEKTIELVHGSKYFFYASSGTHILISTNKDSDNIIGYTESAAVGDYYVDENDKIVDSIFNNNCDMKTIEYIVSEQGITKKAFDDVVTKIGYYFDSGKLFEIYEEEATVYEEATAYGDGNGGKKRELVKKCKPVDVPGFYKDIKGDYIQCTNDNVCEKLEVPFQEDCTSEFDGMLVTVYDDDEGSSDGGSSDSGGSGGGSSSNGDDEEIVVLCTKVNELIGDKVVPGYTGIKFKDSVDRYVVHHAGPVFEFGREKTNYIVKTSNNAIVFDAEFDKDTKGIDHCADIKGKITNRKVDFCSENRSGMYYTCLNGECVAVSQLDRDVKEIGSNDCSENIPINGGGCSIEGYYLVNIEEDEDSSSSSMGEDAVEGYLYKCSHINCEKVTGIGYFKYANKNDEYIVCEEEDKCKISEEIQNIRYEDLYIKSLSDITYLKGNGKEIFEDDKYYVVEEMNVNSDKIVNSIVLDKTYEKDILRIEKDYYECKEGVCEFTCVPDSDIKEYNKRKGCTGYCLKENDLYLCEAVDENSGKNECFKQQKIGYFLNAYLNVEEKYITCKRTENDITCTSEAEPTKDKCDTAGELFINKSNQGTESGKIALCIDPSTESSVDVFDGYKNEIHFIESKVLYDEAIERDLFTLLKIEANSVQPMIVNDIYLYNKKIYKYSYRRGLYTIVNGLNGFYADGYYVGGDAEEGPYNKVLIKCDRKGKTCDKVTEPVGYYMNADADSDLSTRQLIYCDNGNNCNVQIELANVGYYVNAGDNTKLIKCDDSKCEITKVYGSDVYFIYGKENNKLIKCEIESQLNKCSLIPSKTGGYYMNGDYNTSQLIYCGETCKEVKNTKIWPGYYFNNDKTIIKCHMDDDIGMICSKYTLSGDCNSNKYKIVNDNGVIKYCGDEALVLSNIFEPKYVEVKGVKSSEIEYPEDFLGTGNNVMVLRLDNYSVTQVINGLCPDGICLGKGLFYQCSFREPCTSFTLENCDPTSTDIKKKLSCNGYYFNNRKMYTCIADVANVKSTCTEVNTPGFYINSSILEDDNLKTDTKYIRCQTNGADIPVITCDALKTPEPLRAGGGTRDTVETCERKSLFIDDENRIKYCVDGIKNKAIPIKIFNEDYTNDDYNYNYIEYLIPAEILNSSLNSNNKKYYILHTGEEVEKWIEDNYPTYARVAYARKLDGNDRQFLYNTPDSYQTIEDKNGECEGIEDIESEFIEYKKDDIGNTYTKEER